MTNESLKNKITNTILYVLNYIRVNILYFVSWGSQEPNTKNMELVFEDEFETFDKKKWRVGQPWGLFHPKAPYQYYGDRSVFIRNEHLYLNQMYAPKTLTTREVPNTEYHIPYSVGLITSKQVFGYGFYEFEILLPVGRGLWPAVWLTADYSWPPEIDILEAYSDEKAHYYDNIETNIHFNLGDNKTSTGGRKHPINSDTDLLKVSCWWTENFIKIYYNGYLVRQITSKDILQWFKDKQMMIVLNNAIRPEYVDVVGEQISEFEIFSVKVYK